MGAVGKSQGRMIFSDLLRVLSDPEVFCHHTNKRLKQEANDKNQNTINYDAFKKLLPAMVISVNEFKWRLIYIDPFL